MCVCACEKNPSLFVIHTNRRNKFPKNLFNFSFEISVHTHTLADMKMSKFIRHNNEALVENVQSIHLSNLILFPNWLKKISCLNKPKRPTFAIERAHTTKKYCELNASKYNVILNTSHSGLLDFRRALATALYTPSEKRTHVQQRTNPKSKANLTKTIARTMTKRKHTTANKSNSNGNGNKG